MDNLNPNQIPPMPGVEQNKSSGALISVIVILIIIVLGGLYFLKQRADTPKTLPNIEEQRDSITASLETQSSSDEVGSIKADLQGTNVDSLDQGATVFEAQLQ